MFFRTIDSRLGGTKQPAQEVRPRLLSFALVVLALAFAGLVPPSVRAQELATISGRVNTEANQPLSGAVIRVLGTNRFTTTEPSGAFQLQVPPGVWTVEASMIGYRTLQETVTVLGAGTGSVSFTLPVRPLDVGGITVSVLRPDLRPQEELEERQVREANPKDAGDVLRELPGVDAVRRGPLGLDPSVRGLRETEVGTYLDGARMFPAGPGRMDSPLTHLDPSAVSSIEVVKGPYALTWGAGNLAAIRVETAPLPRAGIPVMGRIDVGYDSNRDARETTGSLRGKSGIVSYMVHGAARSGSDYEAGDGSIVPGDFDSWEGRGKVGFELGSRSELTLSGGYQEQGPIDYPGRLLTAEYFESLSLGARFESDQEKGRLSASAYYNDVSHGMDNSGKPTAMPMPGRMPPFALDIEVESGVSVWGGRVALERQLGSETTAEFGADIYSANRDATRWIRRKDTQMEMFVDRMWPDATITDVGVFLRADRAVGPGRVSATGRLDLVSADAKNASEFFLQHRPGDVDLDQSETNLSGALTYALSLNRHWNLSLGIGSAVRTADATERYSDRIPASKAQMSAEFMGNPALAPERSTQGDLWLDGGFDNVAVRVNAFARKVRDYITFQATDLPKRLPLSPPTVFRYVNGEASFVGFEVGLGIGLTDQLTLETSGAYLRGEDDLLGEPAIGIAPLKGTVALRFEEAPGRFFTEAKVRAVSDQDRVATTRGELPTEGYVVTDVRAGVGIGARVTLRFGVENLFDRAYWNHLNAKNPFTGLQIHEPGRVLFFDLGWSF